MTNSTVIKFPESEPLITEGVVVEQEKNQSELFYLFAISIYLMDWHTNLAKAENTKLPPEMFYSKPVLKHENIIYVIAEQMGISTHALAGFLQLHQEEISQIIENAELLKFGAFVKSYIDTRPESKYPVAEATTYYVWERLGADIQNTSQPEWELLWQKIYRFFELTTGVEQVVPERVQEQLARLAVTQMTLGLAA